VVELRIFEGPNLDNAKDITFHYNANFFLFATLEHSRVIAHGRVQTPAANTPPVLTGMPVAGMAYLDRPKEAGYFLFPDLSVRHEGRYRLSFDLYEQAKEDRDMDQVVKEEGESSPLNPEQIPEYFAWRMNIKCKEFVVFSAKKFPGLTESTALSRTVAEQGCRVRIRRDVRMRRRDGKGGGGNGGGNGEFENEEEFSRRRRTATPEAHKEFRQRSMSQESSHRASYSAEAQRRQSGADYPPPPPPSFGGPHSAGAGGHLTFGAAAGPHYHQHGSVPPSPSYPNGAPPGYAHQPSYPPPPPPQQVAHMEERPASQHYPPPSPMSARHSVAGESSRRPSTGYGPPPPSQGEPERVHGSYQYPPPPTPPASRANPPTLPPLSTLITVGGSRPMAPHIMNAAPLEAEPEPLTSRSSFSVGDMVYSAASSHPGKRSFAESDPRADYDRAYKNRSRESERLLLPDPNPSGSRDMPYRRADGRRGYGHYYETQ